MTPVHPASLAATLTLIHSATLLTAGYSAVAKPDAAASVAGTLAPIAPTVRCQPEGSAASMPEPAMPEGVSLPMLYLTMVRLFGKDAAKA